MDDYEHHLVTSALRLLDPVAKLSFAGQYVQVRQNVLDAIAELENAIAGTPVEEPPADRILIEPGETATEYLRRVIEVARARKATEEPDRTIHQCMGCPYAAWDDDAEDWKCHAYHGHPPRDARCYPDWVEDRRDAEADENDRRATE